MSLITTITYDTPGNFSFDTDKVEFVASKAQLKLIDNPGQIFSQDFSSDTGFTYDSGKAEFVGGVVRQKPVVITDETFFSSPLDNTGDGIRGVGSLTATLVNGAGTVDYNGNKYLDISGAVSGRYVSFDAANAAYAGVGTFRMKVVPQYSGSASGNKHLLHVSGNSNANRINLYHDGGSLKILVSRNNGVTQSLATLGSWSAVAGQEYEFELNVNIPGALTSLYIDGVLLGSTGSSVSFTSTITELHVGASYGSSDFYIRDFQIFDSVQHTSDFSGEVPRVINNFQGSKIDGPNFSYSGVGTVLSVDSGAATETGSPRYIVGLQYWNGSAWVVSDGTYVQANDFATALANFPSFNTGGGGVLPWSIVFADSVTQSSVDDFEVEVTGQIYPTDNPSITVSSGVDLDEMTSFIESSTISGSDNIKYILKLSSVDYYWDGAAWSVSNGTYAESNTAAEVEANKALLTPIVLAGKTLRLVALLHSDDGSTTPLLESVVIDYGFSFYCTTQNKCIVYGCIVDNSGNPVVGASISVDGQDFYYGESLIAVQVSTTTDSMGRWDIQIVETETTGNVVDFTIEYDNDGTTITKTEKGIEVPNQATAQLADLV